ncbi:hypothetical protein [Campylobacter coli]|uniref:hypothetical protein n=1 Tax=Campylobacter coli TaxID=195 RepID=UPI00073F3134|nr:hypothetical protein [Campylobacter coli]EAK8023257.1 hypothetical protein [Campylobacter coli]HEB7546541.1 hypothetical protein [Campylobacter coli]HED6587672.1 hypothetical protein [Campylobacter coli]HED6594431.1 hypothetical protein [Campylobacter coli]HED6603294.1 hypothetical protein [Campylobacter coli]
MNFKFFSIIVGILVVVILILSGTYYYLFEYSKPSYTPITQTSTEQNQYSNNTHTTTQNSYVSDITNTNNENINLIQGKQDEKDANNIINDDNKSDTKSSQTTKQNNEEKLAAIEKEISKQQKILEQEKIFKPQNTNNNKTNYQAKKLSPAQEYLSLGKNSRLEPQLSTENMKVYVLDGKFLSDYRIKLLKDMLAIIEDNSKDYFLSVFVKMLPKGEMSLTIYNKDIIFSDMKKSYKYISMDKISPYIKTPEVLNQYVAREEIIERFKLQTKKEGKGSEFSKHINSLKTGLNTAQYFFPFCEIIEITSVK